MTLFCLVDDQDAILKTGRFSTRPADPAGKPWRWLPLAVTKPDYDRESETLDGPVETVEAVQVSRVYTLRALTAREIDDSAAAAFDGELDGAKVIKALAIWAGKKHGLTKAQTRDEILAEYKAL